MLYKINIHINNLLMSTRRQAPPTQTKPINFIMNIKSNDDLRNYLEERPDLNLSIMREKNQSTLIHFAAFKNELSKLRIFVQHYEAYHRRNKHGGAFEGQLKAWINHPNTDGLTPLHFAALHGNTDMLHFLEHHGANMMAQSNEKQTALFMCAENNHLKAAVYLLEHRQGRVPYSPNDANHLGDTILHKSAKHGFSNLTGYLLAHEAVDIDARNLEGWTPLMYAVSGGHKEIVKKMLLKGVNRQLRNLQQKRAIDLARDLGRGDIVRVLQDEFSNWDRVRIGCNFKMVYRVQRPSIKQCILFLFLFHLILIPTHLLIQVDLFGEDSYPIYYAIVAVYYLSVIILFGILTRKHPKKTPKDLMQVQLPCCPQCRNSLKSTEFHCFICGVCVSRYDHHCPWINNCVSGYNIGKFTAFLLLLLLGCVEVMFIRLSVLKPSSLLPIPDDSRNKYDITNMVVSSLLAALFCAMLVSLIGDQLKNLFSNSTSYQRAKNLHKSTLLEQDEVASSASNNDLTASILQDEQQQEKGCFGNCCTMLSEKYENND